MAQGKNICPVWVCQHSFSLSVCSCFLRWDTTGRFCAPVTTLQYLCSSVALSRLFSWPLLFSNTLFREAGQRAKRSCVEKKETGSPSIWMLVLILTWSVLRSALPAKACQTGEAGVYSLKWGAVINQSSPLAPFRILFFYMGKNYASWKPLS